MERQRVYELVGRPDSHEPEHRDSDGVLIRESDHWERRTDATTFFTLGVSYDKDGRVENAGTSTSMAK